MEERDPQELFRESLARCRDRDDFLDRFYDRFMASSEEVRAKFLDTDFDLQKQKLMGALNMAADVVDGNASAMRELHERAESHSHHQLDIKPHLYDLWLDTLLATAAECDPGFSPEVESAWRAVLGHIIAYMQLHY